MSQHYPSSTHVLIVGAGLAGALMACYLGRSGYRVTVCERRPSPHEHPHSRNRSAGGRSINLALSTRGITALEKVGLSQTLLAQTIPMRGRMMHAIDGRLSFQRYSTDPADAINSVERSTLNRVLLDQASEFDNVELHFNRRCLNVDLDLPMAVFEHSDRGIFEEVRADVIIGADGAFSAVRNQMQKLDRFSYSQHYLEHGYKELTIPAVENLPGYTGPDFDGFAMEPHALHIWPRGGYMMIALPNQDRTFTCTCFWPWRGDVSFERIQNADQVIPLFETHFPDAVPLMPNLKDEFMANPTSSLVTIRCFPWHYADRVVLIGDAAHAVVPFYGQGMNAAFEDCRILAEYFEQFAPDWHAVFETFTMHRKRHADAIADMALENFVEMRDKVGSNMFLLKKKTEQALHKVMPQTFTPLYNLISFTNVPYAEALHRVESRNRALMMAAGAAVAIVLVVWAVLTLWLG